jgi:hypothetical protein
MKGDIPSLEGQRLRAQEQMGPDTVSEDSDDTKALLRCDLAGHTRTLMPLLRPRSCIDCGRSVTARRLLKRMNNK